MKFSLKCFVCLITAGSFAFLTACTGAAVKARKDARDKAVATSKMYCSFVNGEIFPDIDVALNIDMAKQCDSDKSFTIAPYKTPSENVGIIYCCSSAMGKATAKAEKFEEPKAEKAKSDKKVNAEAEPAFGE